jgi:hypothetical protein
MIADGRDWALFRRAGPAYRPIRPGNRTKAHRSAVSSAGFDATVPSGEAGIGLSVPARWSWRLTANDELRLQAEHHPHWGTRIGV